MLARCFRGQNSGFYVDVGAAHPIHDSVTMHFYTLGWNGINIEPVPKFYNLLASHRLRDLNLPLAVHSKTGTSTFYEIEDSGLSTLDANISKKAEKLGFTKKKVSVKTKPLSLILQENKVESIDFLKVDVEGAEETVLRSNDWKRFRPKVIVIEATLPGTQIPAWEPWEPYLLSQKYLFVYFDGLNRFYISKEQSKLKAHFLTPPNIFDAFQLYDRKSLRQDSR